MTIGRYIKTKITERGINQTILAEKTGFKNQSNISTFLRDNGNIRINNLFLLLDALDCELIIRDRTTGEEKRIVRE